MSQFLVLCAMMAVVFVQFAHAQLPVPLPPLPVPLPDLPLPDLGLGLAVPAVCPLGYFTLLTDCAPCPAGTTSGLLATACTTCPAGTYAPGPGSTSCTPCAAGTTPTPAQDSCLCSPAKEAKGSKGKAKAKGKGKA
jgi:Tyrosine-protein kinase ephrin type A/B receptor-like